MIISLYNDEEMRRMPQKNIYIRKEDAQIYEMAVNLFGNQGIGAVMAEHLRTIIPQIKDEVFTLLLLDYENLNWVSELVQRRLKDFPEKVILEAKELIEALRNYHPEYFKVREGELGSPWWIELFLGIGGESYIEEGKRLAKECLQDYRIVNRFFKGASNQDPEALKKALVRLAEANPEPIENQSNSSGEELKS